LIFAIVVLALAGFAAYRLIQQNRTGSGQVIIRVGNEPYRTVDLQTPQIITIEQNDSKNVLQISSEGIRMIEASCENQDCIEQGLLNMDNFRQRALGNYIICLPNTVSVELVVE